MAIGFKSKPETIEEYEQESYSDDYIEEYLGLFKAVKVFCVLAIISDVLAIALRILPLAIGLAGIILAVVWLIVVGVPVICTFFTILLSEKFRAFSQKFRSIFEWMFQDDLPVYGYIEKIRPYTNIGLGIIIVIFFILSLTYQIKARNKKSLWLLIGSIFLAIVLVLSIFLTFSIN